MQLKNYTLIKKKIDWWNAKYDLLNGITVYQKDMTNYNILKRCLSGYKKDTIYGFALGYLRLNDLSNWKLKSDDYKFASKLNIQPTTASEQIDHKLYNKEVEVIDYSNGKDPNHKIIKFYDKYIPVNIEYEDLISNTIHNSRFSVMKDTVNYNAMELFSYGIADSVKVGDEDNPKSDCFISARTISFFSNGTLQVDYTIQSINPKGK